MGVYLLQSQIQPIELGKSLASPTPAHCTLMQMFEVDWSQDINSAFESYFASIESPDLEITGEDSFGSDGNIAVWLVKKTVELERAHNDLLALIESTGAKLINPQYCGEGYRPHITKRGDFTAGVGDVLLGQSVALIEFDGINPVNGMKANKLYSYE